VRHIAHHKSYFIQLLLKIKYIKFEYRPKILIKTPVGRKKIFTLRLIKEFPTKNWKRQTLDDFLWKLRSCELNWTHCGDWFPNVLFICRFRFSR